MSHRKSAPACRTTPPLIAYFKLEAATKDELTVKERIVSLNGFVRIASDRVLDPDDARRGALVTTAHGH